MTKFESVLADATQLPVADRIELIEALWETVPESDLPPLSPEWIAEIERRSAEFDAGGVQTTSWDVIKADALQRLARKSD